VRAVWPWTATGATRSPVGLRVLPCRVRRFARAQESSARKLLVDPDLRDPRWVVGTLSIHSYSVAACRALRAGLGRATRSRLFQIINLA
jgi:hypothetical protein